MTGLESLSAAPVLVVGAVIMGAGISALDHLAA